MPDIKLRDGSGVENTYVGVDTITLPLADGSGNWTFGPLINFHPTTLERIFSNGNLIYKEDLYEDNYIIKLVDLTHADNDLSYMFADNNYITDLRGIVIGNTAISSGSVVQTFSNCINLIHLPDINIPISKASSLNSIGGVISGCYSLPQDEIQNLLNTIYTSKKTSSPQGTILSKNYQLKQIDLSKNTSMYGGNNTSWAQGVGNQPTLKSIILPKMSITGATTSNMSLWSSLSNAFGQMYMLSSFKFIYENGEPFVAQMKSQTIDLSSTSSPFGYFGVYSYPGLPDDVYTYSDIQKEHNIYNELDYSSRTFTVQEITDLYNAVKNYDDWHSCGSDYWSCTFDGKTLKPHLLTSRFNHDSAVEFINSLPDTSAYLATAGGTNTIKFRNYQGALTDGGGINDLTPAEIQVATDKGWTVTIVN